MILTTELNGNKCRKTERRAIRFIKKSSARLSANLQGVSMNGKTNANIFLLCASLTIRIISHSSPFVNTFYAICAIRCILILFSVCFIQVLYTAVFRFHFSFAVLPVVRPVCPQICAVWRFKRFIVKLYSEI